MTDPARATTPEHRREDLETELGTETLAEFVRQKAAR